MVAQPSLAFEIHISVAYSVPQRPRVNKATFIAGFTNVCTSEVMDLTSQKHPDQTANINSPSSSLYIRIFKSVLSFVLFLFLCYLNSFLNICMDSSSFPDFSLSNPT